MTATKKFARVALAGERGANATMRQLLEDLDRQVRALNARAKLDPVAARQLDKVLKEQSKAWSDLAKLLDEQREAARKAANTAASEVEKHLLDLLPVDAKTRRALMEGKPFDRSKNAEVARRVSDSARTARKLLVKNLNQADTGKGLATTVRRQISPRTKGGISYVAKRLTRTEIAMAFHEAQIERAANSPWVKGLTWRTSPDHKGPDICDIYNRKTFDVDNVPPIPHPNCMCTLVPELMSETEFKAALAAGVFDEVIGRAPIGVAPWQAIE